MPTQRPPAGDQLGMANLLRAGTNLRCSWHLSQPRARTFESCRTCVNSTRSKLPFSGPYMQRYKATSSLPGSIHAFNGEEYEAGSEPCR